MNITRRAPASTRCTMPKSFTSDTSRTSLSDRRTSNRGPVQTKARLVLVDPLGDGAAHEIMTRDSSLSETTFLLRESLSVGQMCRIELDANGHPARKYLAEVVRARPITGGRYEMAIQFRKPL
jgi:hypothetical protein